MTNEELIQTIRTEIERQKEEAYNSILPDEPKYRTHYKVGKKELCEELLSFLSTLEESEKPMNPDDAMKELDEKIALVKQRGTWDGVDVDKYMDEVRGREPEKPMNQDGLEEAVVDYFEGYWPGMETAEQCNTDLRFTPPAIMRLARHFAQWGAEHLKK